MQFEQRTKVSAMNQGKIWGKENLDLPKIFRGWIS